MQKRRRHNAGGRRGRTLLALIALVALVSLLSAGLGACGGGSSAPSVTGTYKFDSGTATQMAQFKLTLNDDETFKLAGPNPLGGEDAVITGKYTLAGDKISLDMGDGTESEPGTVDGDKLVFADVTWIKE